MLNLGKELNIEIEIFDTYSRPVVAVNQTMLPCQVSKSVCETNNKFLLLQSRKHYLCEGCLQDCRLLSGVFIPLQLPDLAVFALVARSREQQNNLLNNQDSYIRIAEALANLTQSIFNPAGKADPVGQNLDSGSEPRSLDYIIGKEPIIEALKEQVGKIAKSRSIVLITGESGTGKELFARAVHDSSPRWRNPFVAVNCGAIPETLLESELFGYAPGAFTGASRAGKKGKFESAHQGTIFLDEIGDMPYPLQQKLLRVLETGRVDPLGGAVSKELDVRVVAATNQNLRQLIKEGKFRQDLYYRLNVLSLNIPPLRLRKKDIPLLTSHFLKCFYGQMDKRGQQEFSADVQSLFMQYRWPGNIRELRNVVEYAVSLTDDALLTPAHLPVWFWEHLLEDAGLEISMLPIDKIGEGIFLQLLQSQENSAVFKNLSLHEKKKLADKLGVSISTLYRRLKLN